jgi:hypothetical protein
MGKPSTYVGIDQDEWGGMTDVGTIVRDAWVFAIIPETETCTGWDAQRLQGLYDRVAEAWAPYGHLPGRLPEELRERHARIHGEALARAKAMGWTPPMEGDE